MHHSPEVNLKGIKILIHASAWFAPFLLPMITYLIMKDDDVKRLSLQAILFQIVFGGLIGISWIFSYILIGLPFLITFGLIFFITPVVGIVYALQNRYFSYPIVNWFIR